MKRPRLAPLMVGAVLLVTLDGAAVDIIPNERTVVERVGKMDAVLCVRAQAEPIVRAEDWRPALRESNPDVPFQEAILLPVIEQDVEVLEVMKGHSLAAPGTTIRIGTSGGHDGMILDRDWRRRTLEVGATYVVFMLQHPTSKHLRYDRHDVFCLEGPGLAVPYQTPYGHTLLGMSPPAALAHIRDAVASSQR